MERGNINWVAWCISRTAQFHNVIHKLDIYVHNAAQGLEALIESLEGAIQILIRELYDFHILTEI